MTTIKVYLPSTPNTAWQSQEQPLSSSAAGCHVQCPEAARNINIMYHSVYKSNLCRNTRGNT